MDSDSSSYYETTYSQDLRIEKWITERREKEIEEAHQEELKRAANFAKYYSSEKNNINSIFNLPGLHFIKFTFKKIKFSFQPCTVARVSRRTMFYISLRYRKGSWLIKHDSIPANYKLKIYALFFTNTSFRFHDDNIADGIYEIWSILVKWAKTEARFRAEKFLRYRNGDEDVYIDEDDEDLFLSDDEIEELYRKREAIWQRMLPPTKRTLRPKKTIRLPPSTSNSSS